MEDKEAFDGAYCLSTSLDPSESIGDGLVLEPKHKIFLSHSGFQKYFVENVCGALELRERYPFFDRRPSSLPKGKKFPGLILEAAQQCELFVAVLSEEYFMSKWPMIELNAFVQARTKGKSITNLAILPLFYKLFVDNLKDERNRERWFERWETFARADSKGLIKVDDWKFALDELTKYNGLSCGGESKPYEKGVVSHICGLVRPDIKSEDSHVQGNAHEVIKEKILQVGSPQVTVFGLYGVGGIGKTTSCKKLCNELSDGFEGRVCHIELGNPPSSTKELLRDVLMRLLRKRPEDIAQWNEGECKNILYQTLRKQKTFLAIDNVWGNDNSVKQAKVFLICDSHPDSLVLVTSRAERTLELFGVGGGSCLEMPELGLGDARNLFLHHVAEGQQFTSDEDMSSIDECVQRCYFSKGDGRGFHYHPLALEALGRQLGCHGKNPFEWAQVLSKFRNFNAFSGGNPVFGVLRSSFDLLDSSEQALFMDVAVFLQDLDHDIFDRRLPGFKFGFVDHLCAQYKQDERQMQELLNDLKGKGLLQAVDLSSRRLSMHDLYLEFAVLEAKGKSIKDGLGNRRWLYVDSHDEDLAGLEFSPAGGRWENLTRLFIWVREGYNRSAADACESLAGIEWQHFSNVLVLRLSGLEKVKGTLNLTGMKLLRTLLIDGLSSVERLEGLDGLRNLTLFKWDSSSLLYPSICPSDLGVVVGQLPRSLKHLILRPDDLDVEGSICLLSGQDAFALCTNLCKLRLVCVEVGVQLDLSNCCSLEHLVLARIQNLRTLLLPSPRTAPASRQQSIHVEFCLSLDVIRGFDELVCLEHLDLICLAWEAVPSLLSLTKLQTLRLEGAVPEYSPEPRIPRQLQELHYSIEGESMRGSNWNGFNQLQVLDLSTSLDLVSMSEMGDLPALRSLNLRSCYSLRRLPNLSKSRDLEELVLDHCSSLELHEEDIRTLATLPSLRPVTFGSITKLDLRRWKVLRYVGTDDSRPEFSSDCEEGGWKEEEPRPPPIRLGDWGL